MRLIGVEAGGDGIRAGDTRRGSRAAAWACCRARGRSFCRTSDGQIELTHSISAGLDYAAVGPEHAWLRDEGRVEYAFATDDEALKAFQTLREPRGSFPRWRARTRLRRRCKLAPTLAPSDDHLVNLSGRGDKDVQSVRHLLGDVDDDAARKEGAH